MKQVLTTSGNLKELQREKMKKTLQVGVYKVITNKKRERLKPGT